MSGSASCGSMKWSAQQVGIKPTGGGYAFTCSNVVYGVQSIGYDPNFETTPTFELGQSEIYELNEGLPNIDISVSKALDGHPPIFLIASKEASNPSLFGRAPCKSDLALAIFPCDLPSAQGTPDAVCVFSGVQVNSIGYNFGVADAFTEDIGFVGNNMIWRLFPALNGGSHPAMTGCSNATPSSSFVADVATIEFSGCFSTNDHAPRGKVSNREDLIFDYDATSPLDVNGMVADPDTTILPPEVFGIRCSGTNDDNICVNSITVSCDLNRTDLFCLGRRGPKNRTMDLPVSVTTAIEVVAEHDGLVSATEDGVFVVPTGTWDDCVDDDRCASIGTNLQNRTIRIATCDGLRVYLGVRNKLTGYSRGGGTTGGEDATVTYNFQTYNTLTVMHCQDPNPSGTTWWNNRSAYLTNT